MRLASLHRLITLEVDQAPAANKGSLASLERQIAALQKRATELLFANPAGSVHLAEDGFRAKKALELDKILSSPRFKSVMEQAARLPQHRIENQRMDLYAAGILERGTRALAKSPRAASAKQALDEAYALLPTASGSGTAGDAANALGAFLSANLAAVGNLPGPASLSVAVIELHTTFKLPDVAGPIAAYADALGATKSIGGQAARLPPGTPEWHAKLNDLRAAYNRNQVFKDFALDARNKFVKAVGLAEDEVSQLDHALQLGTKDALRDVASMIAGKVHSSTGWHAFTTVLNFLALGAAFVGAGTSQDPFSASNVLNVLGGTASLAVGVMQIAANLAPNGVWGKALGAVGPYFGTVGTVTGILTGTITALTDDDTTSALLAGVQMVGGVFSLAGFLMAVPGLQLAGTAVIIASASYSAWKAIEALGGPGVKHIILAQLRTLQAMPLWQLAASKQNYPELGVQMEAIESALVGQDYAGLYPLNDTPGNRAKLKLLGFGSDDIVRISKLTPVYHMPPC